ncbi:hypothetical protein [Streptomyces sp. NPDC056049]|uniref:hypothetical protein n=1 Tax=Streptomyces sp. NPDC056049 TaxID=3345693 RepID=UPI0035DB5E8C
MAKGVRCGGWNLGNGLTGENGGGGVATRSAAKKTGPPDAEETERTARDVLAA